MSSELTLPKGWEIKTLGEVLIIERGGSPRPISKYLTNSENGLNWIKIADATASDKYIYKTKEKITRDGLHKTRFVEIDDFILSNSMSFGKPYIMKTTGCIHDGWLLLRQNTTKIFETEFLYYLLSSAHVFNQFNSLATGTTVRNLNIALVSSVKVPIPPLAEQQRIVAKLDALFAKIQALETKTKQNLENAKELFKSYLQNVFENKGDDWEEKKLGEICKIRTGKLNANAMVENGIYPFFTCSRDIYSINSFAFDCDAVLLAGNNASGDFNVKFYSGKFNAYQRTYVITTDNLFELELLKYKLENHLSELKKQSLGANTQFLKLGMIKDITLRYPKSKKEQKQIVTKLDALSLKTKKLESIYKTKISLLTELKKSILDKAFKGEL